MISFLRFLNQKQFKKPNTYIPIMALYDENPLTGLISDSQNQKIFLIILTIIAIVLLFFFYVLPFFQAKPLNSNFKDNPLNLNQKSFTILNVTATNTTGNFLELSTIRVEADAKNDFYVGGNPVEIKNISNLGINEQRKLQFDIRPNPSRLGQVLPGTYNFKIVFTSNNETILEQTAVLVVEKN